MPQYKGAKGRTKFSDEMEEKMLLWAVSELRNADKTGAEVR